LNTGAKENPELREQSQEMIDQARDLRRKIDDLRINQLAEEKAKQKLDSDTI
jgi:hypothetical protein